MVAEARWTMKLSKEDERLRRESPAYQPDEAWEELAPQAMQVVLSVRFDPRTAGRINAVARQTNRTPSRLIRDWTVERLSSVSEKQEAGIATSLREQASPYLAVEADYEALRDRYRPASVEILLVGESRPAGGTFFYLANSNLFDATREAFVVALGPMPRGDEFLRYITQHGVWLFDIAEQPIDRLPGRPRKAAVGERIEHLVSLLRETNPVLIIAIKRDLGSAVRQAMHEADVPLNRLHILPFPLYQWRRDYVQRLSQLVRDRRAHQTASTRGGFRRYEPLNR